METTVHDEPSQVGAAERIGQRVWKRIVKHFDSSVVIEHWDEAIVRTAQEARPEYTPEQLQDIVDRWHLLARGMGVAASTVDVAVASIFVGIGLRGAFRFTPIDSKKNRSLHRHVAPGKTRGAQWRDTVLRQIALGSPMLGLAGATVAFRPAKLGLSLAGQAVGVAGENVSRIIRQITHGNSPQIHEFLTK